MKRAALIISALMLTACGGGGATNETVAVNETDTMAADTMMVDPAMNGTAGNMAVGMATVTVTVNGVQPNGGPVLVALQREGDFAQAAGAYTARVEPTTGTVTATIRDVAPGRYAAAVVQDTNNDGTFTVGERGPGEPFGFSGTRQTGAPTFGPASFDVGQAGGTATVQLSGGAAR